MRAASKRESPLRKLMWTCCRGRQGERRRQEKAEKQRPMEEAVKEALKEEERRRQEKAEQQRLNEEPLKEASMRKSLREKLQARMKQNSPRASAPTPAASAPRDPSCLVRRPCASVFRFASGGGASLQTGRRLIVFVSWFPAGGIQFDNTQVSAAWLADSDNGATALDMTGSDQVRIGACAEGATSPPTHWCAERASGEALAPRARAHAPGRAGTCGLMWAFSKNSGSLQLLLGRAHLLGRHHRHGQHPRR